MAITRVGDKFRLDIRPDGLSGRRIRKLFNTRKEAKLFERDFLLGQSSAKSDDRRLSEFVDLWFELHGRSLKSSVDTRDRLLKLSVFLGNPVLRLFSVSDFANYRKRRIDSGISEATLNRELSTLKALYRELQRLQVIDFEFPLLQVRKLKEVRTELSFLDASQISTLMGQVRLSSNESLLFVVQISLATGARWSECEGLTFSNLQNGGFYFTDTKNGYSRFVPVAPWLFDLVFNRLQQGSFISCYGAFRSAFKRSGFEVPKGQLAHILRHTFASHFIMGGGNILVLQKILGHSSLQMTMRYSHLAPDFLNQAVQFNPLANL